MYIAFSSHDKHYKRSQNGTRPRVNHCYLYNYYNVSHFVGYSSVFHIQSAGYVKRI